MSTSSPSQPLKAPSQPATSTTATAVATAAAATSESTPNRQPPPSASTTLTTAPNTTATSVASPSSSSSLPTSQSVTQARTAVVATLSNLLDRKLQTRASTLHANADSLTQQEREVEKATAGLRRERERLEKEAGKAERALREIGSVQNWAEVLERQFLVVEETVRLANGGASGSERSYSGSGGSGSCSCSDCGREEEEELRLAAREDNDGPDGDKGKKREGQEDGDVIMADVAEEEGIQSGWSEASRSVTDAESSTGTGSGQAKGSETASLSTVS